MVGAEAPNPAPAAAGYGVREGDQRRPVDFDAHNATRTRTQRPGLTRQELPSLGDVIRRCRMDVCEAYFRSPVAAVEELSNASLRLGWLVAQGILTAPAAFDPLQEVAENLGLVRRYGQDEIQQAIACGPRLLASMLCNQESEGAPEC